MHLFETYLRAHHLEAIDVSIEAKVRYVTVWNALRGKPITLDHANKIRQTVLKLTGVPYTGVLALLDPPVADIPTIQIKKIPRTNRTEKGHSIKNESL